MKEEDFSEFLGPEEGPVEPIQIDERAQKLGGARSPTLRQQLSRNNAVRYAESTRNYLSDNVRKILKPNDFVEWKQPGVQPGVFELLRDGSYAPAVEIDLHNKSVLEAHSIIWNFILSARKYGHRTVLVVHGKGVRSNPQAMMKSYAVQALIEHRDVLAFCTAPRSLGGLGSTIVQLRKSELAREETRERMGKKSS